MANTTNPPACCIKRIIYPMNNRHWPLDEPKCHYIARIINSYGRCATHWGVVKYIDIFILPRWGHCKGNPWSIAAHMCFLFPGWDIDIEAEVTDA